MRLIWLTRGRSWGFRFLRDGGFEDPLPEYERVFGSFTNDYADFRRLSDGTVAWRLPDPESRRDDVGRLIVHDFAIYPPDADAISTQTDALASVWDRIATEYSDLY